MVAADRTRAALLLERRTVSGPDIDAELAQDPDALGEGENAALTSVKLGGLLPRAGRQLSSALREMASGRGTATVRRYPVLDSFPPGHLSVPRVGQPAYVDVRRT